MELWNVSFENTLLGYVWFLENVKENTRERKQKGKQNERKNEGK